ncbi:DUF262 domain-containing protein [Enterobacter bugandensis]|uniref:DUF262 domain-containing protein n=1 Tax=Enterobacter bugandensis TaxID=881260 RepID=UPI001F46D676|nr:DUF262 domain-containing protein [Enterobacter bugandensis]HDX4396572.1 DUF262 domain-containing protein [Enterobacter bugandensis]
MFDKKQKITDLSLVDAHQFELKVEPEYSGETFDAHPWDPEKIRITTKHFSLREVVDQINDQDIDLSPDFQRDYVWGTQQKIRLIESILLGIPLPAFYFNQESDGSFQIVDGVQRLSTISAFMNNEYSLSSSNLEYLKDLDGKKYDDLPPLELRRFRSTQIVVHVIEPSTPNGIKYDIFSRVNTLGSPLKPQEIRHAMSTARTRNFLKCLIEDESFDLATGYNFWKYEDGKRVRDSGRMTNQELALRYCAFKHNSLDDYRSFSSLDRFLIDFTKRLDGRNSEETGLQSISSEEMKSLEATFFIAMENANIVLGDDAFRRIEPRKRKGPINRAIFESQSIALSEYSREVITLHKIQIREILLNLFNDDDYLKAVTVGTGSPNSVSIRLSKPKNALREYFND